jgi:hypothetical protein
MEKFFKQGSESEPDVAGSALTIMRERGGRWAAYQNFALDSRGLGNVVFVQYGPGRTFETPPPAAPDGAHGAGLALPARRLRRPGDGQHRRGREIVVATSTGSW